MDRLVRKINTSPRSKRKTFVQTADNFGVPLKVLLERDCIKPVPRIVKNICEYLLTNGLNAQGIFRINGSAKLIEALKSTFQISAADDLYSIGNVDIYALAGVLKLFLRELPDGLVSEKHGVKCIKIAKEYATDENMYIFKLQSVLCTLGHENYELLKYLCRFLNKIAENEPVNKMSYNSLGIIFGPCVFRCSLDVQVLKNQGLTNCVMTSLIQHADAIFVHHHKNDFLVLDRLFKLPEIVSNSALPNFEDRVQSSCDTLSGVGRISSATAVESPNENEVLSLSKTMPLISQNSANPHNLEMHHQVEVLPDYSPCKPKISRTNVNPARPGSLHDISLQDKGFSLTNSPDCYSTRLNQDKEVAVTPSTSSTTSPVTFDISNTPTYTSRSNSVSHDETVNTGGISDSDADAEELYKKTPEQLALDITDIITSFAAGTSVEAWCSQSQSQSDNYYNSSAQVSNCNSKSDYISQESDERLPISGLSSQSQNTPNELVDSYNASNSTKLRRISSQRKYSTKQSDLNLITTWNSMPSIEKNTTETLVQCTDIILPVNDETYEKFDIPCQMPRSVATNSATNTCEFSPSSFQMENKQDADLGTEEMTDLSHLSHMPTVESGRYCDLPDANNLNESSPRTQISPRISECSLTQAINQCLDTHMFSFKQQIPPSPCHSGSLPDSLNNTTHVVSSHINSVPVSAKPKSPKLYHSEKLLHASRNRLPDAVGINRAYDSSSIIKADQQERSLPSRHSFHCATLLMPLRSSVVHQIKKYNQSAPTSPIVVNPNASFTFEKKSKLLDEYPNKPPDSFLRELPVHQSNTPSALDPQIEGLKKSAANCQALPLPELFEVETNQKLKQQNSLGNRSLQSPNDENEICDNLLGNQPAKSHASIRQTINPNSQKNAFIINSTLVGGYSKKHLKEKADPPMELESIPCLSNKSHSLSAVNSRSDLYIESRLLSPRLRHKYKSMQQLMNRDDEISRLTKIPSNVKLATEGKKSPTTTTTTTTCMLHTSKEEDTLLSPVENKSDRAQCESSIPLQHSRLVRRVKSFTSNNQPSSKVRSLIVRKYSAVSSAKSVARNFLKTVDGDDDNNVDNSGMKQLKTPLVSLESFYDLLCAVLSEQRRCCGRPEHLSEMNWDQIEQEKFDIQKGLLYFEGLYGRPKTPKSKRIMKPVYERYRQVKRLVASRHGGSLLGVNSQFPFGKDLSHLKIVSTNDVDEKLTNNQLPLLVSDELMKLLGTPTRTPEALLLDNIQDDMDSDSDFSVSQCVNKCEKPAPPPVEESNQPDVVLKSSDNHNLLTDDNQSARFAFKSNCRRSLMRPNDREIQLFYKQICSLTPMELYSEKKNILLKKHIVQTELVEYENNIQRLLGRKPTRTEREPIREKYEVYALIKRQLKAIDSCLNLCSSDLINIQCDSNNSNNNNNTNNNNDNNCME
ncbi:unnamed protein product [Trichobilharzia szidati]|nr:unnamed protein product [Trichobilharzia szidati]